VTKQFNLIGQTCRIDDSGVMGPAIGVEDISGKFKVENHCKEGVYIGISCPLGISNGPKITADTGDGVFYMSPMKLLPKETITLTPVNKVKVWFQADATLGFTEGMMVGRAQEVEFADDKPKTISYNEGGFWQAGSIVATATEGSEAV
jgi:hypothetical protein